MDGESARLEHAIWVSSLSYQGLYESIGKSNKYGFNMGWQIAT